MSASQEYATLTRNKVLQRSVSNIPIWQFPQPLVCLSFPQSSKDHAICHTSTPELKSNVCLNSSDYTRQHGKTKGFLYPTSTQRGEVTKYIYSRTVLTVSSIFLCLLEYFHVMLLYTSLLLLDYI